VANRELVSKMITKWRKQDIMRSLYQWQRNAQASKQERTDGGAWRMLLATSCHPTRFEPSFLAFDANL